MNLLAGLTLLLEILENSWNYKFFPQGPENPWNSFLTATTPSNLLNFLKYFAKLEASHSLYIFVKCCTQVVSWPSVYSKLGLENTDFALISVNFKICGSEIFILTPWNLLESSWNFASSYPQAKRRTSHLSKLILLSKFHCSNHNIKYMWSWTFIPGPKSMNPVSGNSSSIHGVRWETTV